MADKEADALRHDPVFLLDCLYSEDAAIRVAAGGALEKMSGVKVDPKLTGTALDETVDRIYSALFPPLATQPTTRP